VGDTLKEGRTGRSLYERFEQGILTVLVVVISLMVVYATILAVVDIVGDARQGMNFLTTEVLQDAFGSLLTVLILLEFNHSIVLALRTRTGAIQVRVVVLIAILALARKLILLDYKTASLETLLGLGGIALALGALYWLIANGDRRKAAHDAE
jgi:uncharacterized membrane protein (DUF373 family)